MFKLNRTTGEVTLAGKLDYEKRKYYTLVIRANNPGEIDIEGTTTVIIHVTDDNDNPPVIYDYPKDTIRVDLVILCLKLSLAIHPLLLETVRSTTRPVRQRASNFSSKMSPKLFGDVQF